MEVRATEGLLNRLILMFSCSNICLFIITCMPNFSNMIALLFATNSLPFILYFCFTAVRQSCKSSVFAHSNRTSAGFLMFSAMKHSNICDMKHRFISSNNTGILNGNTFEIQCMICMSERTIAASNHLKRHRCGFLGIASWKEEAPQNHMAHVNPSQRYKPLTEGAFVASTSRH